MLKWGRRSRQNLDMLSGGLKAVLYRALEYEIMDFAVVETFRDEQRQNQMFIDGKSKVRWPHGKHNSNPSKAADCVPWIDNTVSWNKLHCCVLAGIILAAASELGIVVRWGGNWDMDFEPITDQDFQDLVHFEEV